MEKRFKSIAIVMALVMGMTFTAPSAALAYWGYGYHHHHHHRLSKGAAWGLGIGLLGLAFLAHKNTNKAYDSSIVPTTYITTSDGAVVYNPSLLSARQVFLNSLDREEAKLFAELNVLRPSEPGKTYRYNFGNKSVTKRRLEKIMRNLSDEYSFDGVSNGYVYFRKLR